MFNPACFANSRPDGVAVLEIVEPVEEKQKARLFVPLRRTELEGEVAGPLASLRVVHHFGFTKDQCPKVIEASYRCPLPGDAAVTGVKVRFGKVEIEAALKEREEAERDYEVAKREGRQAALLSRESPDVFTLQVAGIKPDEDVRIETTYVQLAQAEGSGWMLRVPLTTAPRYTRSDEEGSPHARGQPLAVFRDPGHKFAVDLTISGAGAVKSPTHQVETSAASASKEDVRVRLRDREVVPDRDFVLTWEPAREKDKPSFRVFTWPDESTDKVHFLALAAPPSGGKVDTAAREVIVLVDHSGSMDGPKREAADWTVKKFIRGLKPRDAFALCVFDTRQRWLSPATRTADPTALDEAEKFLGAARDGGGTELGVALEQAVAVPAAQGERARHILIITDDQASDQGRILRLAEEQGRKNGRRISVLCIDSAPNSFLARETAKRGGGIARFLTSQPEEGDITTALDDILEDWSAPVLTGLRLEVDRPEVQPSARRRVEIQERGWSAVDLGDLPRTRAVWVAGRVDAGKGGKLRFRLRARGSKDPVAEAGASKGSAAIKALSGAPRVATLEFLAASDRGEEEVREHLSRLGYNPDEALSSKIKRAVYAENRRGEATKALRPLLVKEALDAGLASSVTSFVAVRKEAGKKVEAEVAVANALPHGWSDHFAGGSIAMMSMTVGAVGSSASFASRGGSHVYAARAAMPAPQAAPRSLYRIRAATRVEEMHLTKASLAATDDDAAGLHLLSSDVEEEAPKVAALAPARVAFRGKPKFDGDEAVLFDEALKEEATLTRLEAALSGGAKDVPADVWMLVYVDDMVQPRVKARLADVLAARGERPVNVRVAPGQRVKVVISDLDGSWRKKAPEVEVRLR